MAQRGAWRGSRTAGGFLLWVVFFFLPFILFQRLPLFYHSWRGGGVGRREGDGEEEPGFEGQQAARRWVKGGRKVRAPPPLPSTRPPLTTAAISP